MFGGSGLDEVIYHVTVTCDDGRSAEAHVTGDASAASSEAEVLRAGLEADGGRVVSTMIQRVR